MDCTWFPGYGPGWFWTGRIFWLLLLAGIGLLLVLAVRRFRPCAAPGDFSESARTAGKCPNCGEPVEQAYLRCPECHYRLKVNCPSCGKLVKTSWELCPYCEAPLTEKSQTLVNH